MEKARRIIPESEMMNQELVNILPSEIIMSILSKLPVRTIMICKCVCRSWLHLVETREFVKLHLSTSLPGLVTFQITMDDNICICNPITRDYIKICSPPKFPRASHRIVTWGFGSCKMTGQYKVVRVLLDRKFDKGTRICRVMSVSSCHVYTLGTGSVWRSLEPCALPCVPHKDNRLGAFVNGNLNWLGRDLEHCLWISYFDLETESFSKFSSPLVAQEGHLYELFALGESLCLIDSTLKNENVIWSMEEYGVAESWTKKLVINLDLDDGWPVSGIQPIKVFKNGDMLLTVKIKFMLFYYSRKTDTVQQVERINGNCPDNRLFSAISHTPSFRSLKSFGMENVSSF